MSDDPQSWGPSSVTFAIDNKDDAEYSVWVTIMLIHFFIVILHNRLTTPGTPAQLILGSTVSNPTSVIDVV